MYEFEALLFASPESVGSMFGSEKYTIWAQNILNEFQGNPELVNDSEQTAPSKRFIKDTPYKKTVHGPDIALLAGLQTIRDTCFGFNSWIKKIELLE